MASTAQLEHDARMTAHRRETKYLVSQAHARLLAKELDRQLESHRHRGEGANQLPAAQHYVTTIYFDTANRALFRAAEGSAEQHLKLRAKEYYDLHPGLTETATDLRQIVRFQPVLWLELKHKDGAHTGKQRIGIPKRDVPAFFAKGQITDEMIAIQEQAHGSEGRSVLRAVADLCATCSDPLGADCLVNYRRHAWQDAAGELRVTIDTKLAYFAPPADLWEREWALVRPSLGTPVASADRCVLEIKGHGAHPDWLADFLHSHHIAPLSFSKFGAASSAVHG